ncbi:hypothetical protein K439DRAFT_1613257 [Ramaria rubella]|nr:hypothetical protein K439DRAFT_1613257 [Ramaria rubella]
MPGPKRGNQHKPCHEYVVIGPLIQRYFDMGMNDHEILTQLVERHIDLSRYGLGIHTLKKMCQQLGLKSTRQQGHTIETATEAIQRVRACYPKAGMRDMRLHTFREEGLKISRKVMEEYFKTYEPEGVKQRKARRLKRQRFWAAGVNDIWAINQHNKLKRFLLYLHTGVEPYSGMILWLRVWWTNKNPRLILQYYLDAVQQYGGMPLVTQSDPGSENYGVANGHTMGHHMVDPTLEGVEDLLDEGLNQGWYDLNEPLDMRVIVSYMLILLLFRWLLIPWLQGELDAWRDSHNMTSKHANKNKILPHGRPQLIFEAPRMFDIPALDEIRNEFTPADDPVFLLVPCAFDNLSHSIYASIGQPTIVRSTIWGIYAQMLVQIRHTYSTHPSPDLQAACESSLVNQDFGPGSPIIPLTAGLWELCNGNTIIGPGFTHPEDSIDGLITGGSCFNELCGDRQTMDNYPALFDLEDNTAALEANEMAMVCGQFSDNELDAVTEDE